MHSFERLLWELQEMKSFFLSYSEKIEKTCEMIYMKWVSVCNLAIGYLRAEKWMLLKGRRSFQAAVAAVDMQTWCVPKSEWK